MLAAILCGWCAAAQPRTDANIAGHVVSAKTGEHLPFIGLSLKGTTIGMVTDATGHYFLKNLPEGTYSLVASGVGYESEEREVTLRRGKTLEVNFVLSETAIDVDEVVVSANRGEASRREAATIVGVVSARALESTASNNLAEGLNYQPGLRVEYNCSNCGVPQLRINGLEGQYSQILLDSRPIFSSLASVYGLEQLPAGMIERTEVIRGGGSALFGANAIGGVVNIITKEPVRNTLTVSNVTSLLDGKRHDINTTLNGAFVSDDYRAGIYLFGMVRDRQHYDRNGDGFSEAPELGSETVGFRGYYKTGTYSKLTAEYHHIREFRRGGNRFDRPPHEADIAEQLRHNIDGGGLNFDLFSKDYRHRANFYVSAQHIGRDSYFGTNQNPDAYGKTNDETFVGGTQYAYSFRKLLFLPSELTFGAEFHYNRLHDRMLGYGRDMNQRTRTVGGYVQNEWKSEKVNFLLGARLDKHNLIDHAVFSPRVNFRYSPVKAVALRASYSSGYRAPQAYDEDLHVAAVGGDVALIELAPGLKPEYSHSVSGSLDLYRNFGSVQTNLLIEGFYTDLQDVFDLKEAGRDAAGNLILQRYNAPGATIRGINAELKAAFSPRVVLQAGYTWQRSRYREPVSWSEETAPQRRMFRTPDSYGYAVLTAGVARNFDVSLSGNYTGPMLVKHYAGYVEKDTETVTPRFWDLGFRLDYDIRLSAAFTVEVSAGMKNVLDRFQKDIDCGTDRDAKYIYGPALPRTFFFGVKFML